MSHCVCARRIKWRYIVPILSWTLLPATSLQRAKSVKWIWAKLPSFGDRPLSIHFYALPLLKFALPKFPRRDEISHLLTFGDLSWRLLIQITRPLRAAISYQEYELLLQVSLLRLTVRSQLNGAMFYGWATNGPTEFFIWKAECWKDPFHNLGNNSGSLIRDKARPEIGEKRWQPIRRIFTN